MTVIKFHVERISRGSPKQRFDVPVKELREGTKDDKMVEIDLNLLEFALLKDNL